MTLGFVKMSKRKNSTKTPATYTVSTSAVFKQPCNLMTPSVILDTQYSAYNYMFFYDTESARYRYYFQTGVVLLNNNMCEISYEEDVMSTFKSNIRSATALIGRTSDPTYYDTYLSDTTYPAKQGKSVTAISKDIGITGIDGMYCVGLACKALTSPITIRGSIKYVMMTPNQMGTFAGMLTHITSFTGSIFDFVVSCVYIPFDLSDIYSETITDTFDVPGITWASQATRTFNYQSMDTYYDMDVSVQVVHSSSVTLGHHTLSSSRGAFLNYAPWFNCTWVSGIFGSIPIPIENFNVNTRTLGIRIICDMPTGECRLQLTRGANNHVIIYDTFAQVGVPTQLARLTTNQFTAGASTLMSVGSTIAGVASGNVAMAVGGLASSITSAVDFVTPKIDSKGSNGSFTVCENWQQDNNNLTYFVYEEYTPTDESIDDYGRPSMKEVKISNFDDGSFVKCVHFHVDFPCNEYERAQIESICESGFIYE